MAYPFRGDWSRLASCCCDVLIGGVTIERNGWRWERQAAGAVARLGMPWSSWKCKEKEEGHAEDSWSGVRSQPGSSWRRDNSLIWDARGL